MKTIYSQFVHEYTDQTGQTRYAVADFDGLVYFRPATRHERETTGVHVTFGVTPAEMGGFTTRTQALRNARYIFAAYPKMVSINNGLTFVLAAELTRDEINEKWDALVMMMDDEIREIAHNRELDFMEFLAGLFDPETPFGSFEDKLRFLDRYLRYAQDNLIIG